MQISPETTPPLPSSPESCTGTLTLASDIKGAGGTKELLDLKPKAIQALPPKGPGTPLIPTASKDAEVEGPSDRRREERVALEIALFYYRRGKTVRVATPSAHYVKVNKDVPLNGRGLPYYMKLFMDVHAC